MDKKSVTCRKEQPKVILLENESEAKLSEVEQQPDQLALPDLVKPLQAPKVKKPSTTRHSVRKTFDLTSLSTPRSLIPEGDLFNSGGCGGVLVGEHYRVLEEMEYRRELAKKKSMIAPRLGTPAYFDWLKS